MTFVVTEPCYKCKEKACVDPCPVDCFREADAYLVTDPNLCIDCNVCVTECPVDAIFQDKDVPADQRRYLDFNREMSKVLPPATPVGCTG